MVNNMKDNPYTLIRMVVKYKENTENIEMELDGKFTTLVTLYSFLRTLKIYTFYSFGT